MPQNYKCGICDSKPDQLSHHKSHLSTQKHKDKTSIFRLKLQTLSSTELQTQYNATNIDEIINKQETIKLVKIIKKKPETQLKKTISGETIWNLETNGGCNQLDRFNLSRDPLVPGKHGPQLVLLKIFLERTLQQKFSFVPRNILLWITWSILCKIPWKERIFGLRA